MLTTALEIDHELSESISSSGLTDMPAADIDPTPLADRLLTALATMAVRSKRRQADLAAALRRSGLDVTSERLGLALRHLERHGYIENLVPLYDGGMLMSVTSRGVEKQNAHRNWSMLDDKDFGTVYGRAS